MAVKTKAGAWGSTTYSDTAPKKTRQGRGKHTKYAATSRNLPPKRYRGQGKKIPGTRKSPFLVKRGKKDERTRFFRQLSKSPTSKNAS